MLDCHCLPTAGQHVPICSSFNARPVTWPEPTVPNCSDVSKGRILLPRAAVEANLSFAIGKAHSLIARDHQQQTWEFTLQSWANGKGRKGASG